MKFAQSAVAKLLTVAILTVAILTVAIPCLQVNAQIIQAPGTPPVIRDPGAPPVATNCSAMLQDYVNWTKQSNAGYSYYLSFKMVSITSDNKYATYTAGNGSGGGGLYGEILPGTSSYGLATSDSYSPIQYFSNRLWYGQGDFPPSYPFDPNSVDKVGISINPSSNRVTLTFTNQKGNKSQQNVIPVCANGLMYAAYTHYPATKLLSPWTEMYVISFSKGSMKYPT